MTHKTAIKRVKPSLPMQYLAQNDLLIGRKLDFGCGQGFDAQNFDMEKYDPYFAKTMPEGQFDTITCNYVLNVIQDNSAVLDVLDTILAKLVPTGTAYISVRADVKQDGPTTKGYQRNIHLDKITTAYNLQLIKSNTGFRMYKLTH